MAEVNVEAQHIDIQELPYVFSPVIACTRCVGKVTVAAASGKLSAVSKIEGTGLTGECLVLAKLCPNLSELLFHATLLLLFVLTSSYV